MQLLLFYYFGSLSILPSVSLPATAGTFFSMKKLTVRYLPGQAQLRISLKVGYFPQELA